MNFHRSCLLTKYANSIVRMSTSSAVCKMWTLLPLCRLSFGKNPPKARAALYMQLHRLLAAIQAEPVLKGQLHHCRVGSVQEVLLDLHLPSQMRTPTTISHRHQSWKPAPANSRCGL